MTPKIVEKKKRKMNNKNCTSNPSTQERGKKKKLGNRLNRKPKIKWQELCVNISIIIINVAKLTY